MKKNYQEEDHEVEVVPNAWSSELPADLLGLITVKILSSFAIPEFIRFGCVCVEWRSFSIENYQHIKLPDKLPVLIIPIPPSSLLLTEKKIPSSSSSSSDHEENYEEEEEKELEEREKEKMVVEVKVEEEEEEEKADEDHEDDYIFLKICQRVF